MAQFADYTKPPQDPNYLGMSKEIDVPRVDNTLASTVKDVGKLAIDAVGAVDEMNKNTIDKQLLAGVNERRQEDIQTGLDILSGNPGTPPATEDHPDVPHALNSGLRRAAHITQAKKMGKMGNELYYADMQGIAQGLINQYPGYERYINDRMSHWLGTNPANAQRAAILETLQNQYATTNSEQNKWNTFVRSNLEHFYTADGQFNQPMFQRAQSAFGNSEAMADVEMYVAKMQSQKQFIATSKAAFDLKVAQRTATEADALTAYRGAATAELNKVLTTQSFNIGDMSFNWTKVKSVLDTAKANGGRIDPESLAQLGVVIGRFEQHADQKMRELANDPKFMSLVQDPTKLEAVRKELLGVFAGVKSDVGAGNTHLATATINTLEGISNNDALRAIQGNEVLRRWNTYKLVAGPGAGALIEREIATSPGFNMPNQVTNQLSLLHRMSTISGQPSSLQKMVEDYNRVHNIVGTPTPQQQANRADYLNAQLELNKQVILDPTAPVSAKINVAKFIAQGANTSFLTKLPLDQQMSTWANISSPQVATELKKTLPPNEWRNFRTWSQETFKALVNTQASQITQGARDSQGTNITFDEGSNRLRFDNSRRTSQGRSGPVPISKQTENAIEELNLGLQTYANILKLDGRKLDQYELEALGIKLTKPETGGSKGTGSGNKRTSEAPNGSEGLSTVSFITPANASGLEIPPSDRVREGFRAIRNMEDNDPSRFIYDDAGVRDQLRERATQGFPQPRR